MDPLPRGLDSTNLPRGGPAGNPGTNDPTSHRPNSRPPGAADDGTLVGGPRPPAPSAPAGSFPFLTPTDRPGELGRLGPYRVIRLLGEGGMGFVFRAEDEALQRPVALKVMRPEVAAQPTARERFLREGRAAAAVKSDHVITIHQVAEANGVPYLAMEYLDGLNLEDWLLERQRRQPGPVPPRVFVRVAKDVLKGLAAAHDKGLIHRDIKPANLWIEARTSRLKLLDFGLTRGGDSNVDLTDTGQVLGTAPYMAPEQARGLPVDARADLFSVGVVLYRMLAGQSPFRRETYNATIIAVVTETPKPAASFGTLPAALSDLVDRLMAKNPADRPPSAKAALAVVAEVDQQLRAADKERERAEAGRNPTEDERSRLRQVDWDSSPPAPMPTRSRAPEGIPEPTPSSQRQTRSRAPADLPPVFPLPGRKVADRTDEPHPTPRPPAGHSPIRPLLVGLVLGVLALFVAGTLVEVVSERSLLRWFEVAGRNGSEMKYERDKIADERDKITAERDKLRVERDGLRDAESIAARRIVAQDIELKTLWGELKVAKQNLEVAESKMRAIMDAPPKIVPPAPIWVVSPTAILGTADKATTVDLFRVSPVGKRPVLKYFPQKGNPKSEPSGEGGVRLTGDDGYDATLTIDANGLVRLTGTKLGQYPLLGMGVIQVDRENGPPIRWQAFTTKEVVSYPLVSPKTDVLGKRATFTVDIPLLLQGNFKTEFQDWLKHAGQLDLKDGARVRVNGMEYVLMRSKVGNGLQIDAKGPAPEVRMRFNPIEKVAGECKILVELIYPDRTPLVLDVRIVDVVVQRWIDLNEPQELIRIREER